jgi:hypothetical protein
MDQLQGFDYATLDFDEKGKPVDAASIAAFVTYAATEPVTDVVLFAHGWRNSAGEANLLYSRFLETFRDHLEDPRLGPRLKEKRFLVGGIIWPSKPFLEGQEPEAQGRTAGVGDADDWQADVIAQLEDLRDHDASEAQKEALNRAIELVPDLAGDPAVQDEFAAQVMTVLDGAVADVHEGLDVFRSQPGSAVLQWLGFPVIFPIRNTGSEGGVRSAGAVAFTPAGAGGTAGIGDVFHSIGNRVRQFLNFTTWYLMLDRCGVVGETGVAQTVRDLRKAKPELRIHLVGHSLGGRLMVACANALTREPAVRVQTLALLQAAFSHFGLAPDGDGRKAGYFRSVITGKPVDGPILVTFSDLDRVVGYAYALAERVVRNNVRAIGDKDDPYGGMGRNGAQATPEAEEIALLEPGQAYAFQPGGIYSLNGCGIIEDHSDVKRPEVTWAFASAVAG